MIGIDKTDIDMKEIGNTVEAMEIEGVQARTNMYERGRGTEGAMEGEIAPLGSRGTLTGEKPRDGEGTGRETIALTTTIKTGSTTGVEIVIGPGLMTGAERDTGDIYQTMTGNRD